MHSGWPLRQFVIVPLMDREYKWSYNKQRILNPPPTKSLITESFSISKSLSLKTFQNMQYKNAFNTLNRKER